MGRASRLMIVGRLLGAFGLLAAVPGCVGAAAPVQQSIGYGSACYAGVYTCRLGAQFPVGTQCTCPGLGAPSFGTVH